MAVIMDYLDWRGDLPFSLDSFNEVDGYILAKFGCPDYTGAVPDTPDAISIGSAVKQYFALHGEEEGEKLGVLASSEIIVEKKTKKGMKNIDLKPYILSFEPRDGDRVSFDLKLPAGSTLNINPNLLIGAFADQLGIELYADITRAAIYTKGGEEFA